MNNFVKLKKLIASLEVNGITLPMEEINCFGYFFDERSGRVKHSCYVVVVGLSHH